MTAKRRDGDPRSPSEILENILLRFGSGFERDDRDCALVEILVESERALRDGGGQMAYNYEVAGLRLLAHDLRDLAKP